VNLSLLGYCWWSGAIQLAIMIEIKSVSVAAGLLLRARGYSTATPNSGKKCTFRCWAIVGG
jgi:hypothetical protein